jgi:hypothetical protein
MKASKYFTAPQENVGAFVKFIKAKYGSQHPQLATRNPGSFISKRIHRIHLRCLQSLIDDRQHADSQG